MMPGPEERSSGFRILEHPADIGIEAWATTTAEAFGVAAHGLISIILDPTLIQRRTTRVVELHATDRDQLLVKWLEEILYLYDGEGFVVRSSDVTQLTTTTLTATLTGEPFDPDRHESRLDVKAVTYHQLLITEGGGISTVRIYLDI